MLPGRGFFLDPARCGHWDFRINCISRYWVLLMDMGFRELRMSGGERRAGWFHQIMLSPIGMRVNSEDILQQIVCNKTGVQLGDYVWKTGETKKDLQLAYPLL